MPPCATRLDGQSVANSGETGPAGRSAPFLILALPCPLLGMGSLRIGAHPSPLSPIIQRRTLGAEGAAGNGTPVGGRAAAHRGPESGVGSGGRRGQAERLSILGARPLVRGQGSVSLAISSSRQGLSQSLPEKSSASGTDSCHPELGASAVESAASSRSGAGGVSPRLFSLPATRTGVSAVAAATTPHATSRGCGALNPCPCGHDGGVSLLSPRFMLQRSRGVHLYGSLLLGFPEPSPRVTPGTLPTTRSPELRALPRKGAQPGPTRPIPRGEQALIPHLPDAGGGPSTPAPFFRLEAHGALRSRAPWPIVSCGETRKPERHRPVLLSGDLSR